MGRSSRMRRFENLMPTTCPHARNIEMYPSDCPHDMIRRDASFPDEPGTEWRCETCNKNRELKAQMARATRLLEEALAEAEGLRTNYAALATQNATLWRALTEQMRWVNEMPPSDLDFDMMDEYRYAVAQSKTALRDPSPLAEAAGVVIEAAVAENEVYNNWCYEDATAEDTLKASNALSEAVDTYRALRDSMPPEYGRAIEDRPSDEEMWLAQIDAGSSDDAEAVQDE